VTWCNLNGQTEGGKTKIKLKFRLKNLQKQNGLLVFASLRWKKINRKRRQREAVELYVKSIVMFK
jgi:hypothetical protein